MKDRSAGVLKRLASVLSPGREGSSMVIWRPDSAIYPRLASFDPRPLAGQAGLYLLWHLGVRPQWLRAGFSADLGGAAAHLAKTPEITAFIPHDGPFFSWAFCAPDLAQGLVNSLANRLNPVLQDLVLGCDVTVDPTVPPIACGLPLGTKDIRTH